VAEVGSRATIGEGAQIWHGSGVLKDLEKKYIQEYFHRIEHKLEDVLEKNGKEPLVLAAVDFLHPIYRDVNKYSGLITSGLMGNPDNLTEQELHDKTWLLVEPEFNRDMRLALDNYHLAASKGLASSDPGQVLAATSDGRVRVLFMAMDERLSGSYDPDTRKTTLLEKDQGIDLLDLAAFTALGKGARVYLIDRIQMPDKSLVAAEFRY
jgi:hypothetical protein